jgi:hypothetical protein
MLYLIIVVFFVLLALVLRFVQPELIYSLRQVLVKIGMNKVQLDDEAGRTGLSSRYHELLIKDLRFETLGHDSAYALKRINKIRELYSTLDMQRHSDLNVKKELRPHVCIIELANLLKNLGEHMTPEKHIHYPTVKADQILKLIAREVTSIMEPEAVGASGNPKTPTGSTAEAATTDRTDPLTNNSALERWFRENPMSIEQTIEILIAAVFGLAYRQKTSELYELHRNNGNMLVNE